MDSHRPHLRLRHHQRLGRMHRRRHRSQYQFDLDLELIHNCP